MILYNFLFFIFEKISPVFVFVWYKLMSWPKFNNFVSPVIKHYHDMLFIGPFWVWERLMVRMSFGFFGFIVLCLKFKFTLTRVVLVLFGCFLISLIIVWVIMVLERRQVLVRDETDAFGLVSSQPKGLLGRFGIFLLDFKDFWFRFFGQGGILSKWFYEAVRLYVAHFTIPLTKFFRIDNNFVRVCIYFCMCCFSIFYVFFFIPSFISLGYAPIY